MTELTKIIDVDLAEDIKNLVKLNSEVEVIAAVKQKIEEFNNDDLVKVTKEIGSLKIIDVELLDEELLAKEL